MTTRYIYHIISQNSWKSQGQTGVRIFWQPQNFNTFQLCVVQNFVRTWHQKSETKEMSTLIRKYLQIFSILSYDIQNFLFSTFLKNLNWLLLRRKSRQLPAKPPFRKQNVQFVTHNYEKVSIVSKLWKFLQKRIC